VYDWVRNAYSESSALPENLTFKSRGRISWAAVWSYTQDEIYWPISGHVLDFCGRKVSCHSQGSNIHIAAVFYFLHMWASFFLFNKHQEHIISFQ
jgi:hypothetical protein